MHHHHPLSAVTMSTSLSAGGAHAHQRRRKKRPNYGTRTVEVRRGYNGFGFTISGQQPCRLSCIVANSPADQAGLRAGDFLISVNGLNVSKLPHETVVQLIGNSFGSIRMQIAENYYSDSSDEENAAFMLQQQGASVSHMGTNNLSMSFGMAGVGGARAKPRYLHHKTKMHRLRNSPQKKRSVQQQYAVSLQQSDTLMSSISFSVIPMETLRPLIEDLPLTMQHGTGINTNAHASGGAAENNGAKVVTPMVSSDVANVSAMVRVPTAALEYRAIVGYLGTIEMPKQISHSSKLQTVRSCIRKLRQEKRQPTTVLMTILPDCLRLQAANGSVLASYASERLNYVSSSSESENRFFGLVTSAVHTSQMDEEEYDDDDDDDDEDNGNKGDLSMATNARPGHISISNSCHVFVVDTKLCEHANHIARATEFRILCTKDPISSLCLEFPSNSEYVVNLIRSMYTMRILPPASKHAADDCQNGVPALGQAGAAAHSPQPSNHSEISTTTSNSDSGIGFHNDCTNISDRILVVDFPGAPELRIRPAAARPLGIFNHFDAIADKRLTVRAMPDPRTPTTPAKPARPNLLDSFNLIKSPASSLTATRSCDDVLSLMERTPYADNESQLLLPHASMDNISLHSTATVAAEDHLFLRPAPCLGASNSKTQRRQHNSKEFYSLQTQTTTPSKLSPQVFLGAFGTPIKTIPATGNSMPTKRDSMGFEAIDAGGHHFANTAATYNPQHNLDMWSSLQDLHGVTENVFQSPPDGYTLETSNSEPDIGNRALPANASPFRRAWGQSSFRTTRTDKQAQPYNQFQQNSPAVRRAASMTASDNDVYLKSMDTNRYIEELKQAHCQQQIATKTNGAGDGSVLPSTPFKSSNSSANIQFSLPQLKVEKSVASTTSANEPAGVAGWASSFERLIEHPAGLHTFAEFLKKEFSAENIYFWTACERYRHLDNVTERAAQAKAIFSKHLANGALEPVNVDSQARNLNEEKLQTAERDIFAPAQKQIFNLMKFDSYQRFIRSDLYKSCLEAEEKQLPLPFSGDNLDELLKINFHQNAITKLKKSASNAEDRRRKSLLPWHRKTRSKSRDRVEGGADGGKGSSKLVHLSGNSLKIPSSSTQNSTSDLHSSRSSLSSFDALPGAMSTLKSNGQPADGNNTCSLCRVILTDGATTIVQTRPGETVGQLVERLLEKRGLTYHFYDVVPSGSTKSIDLQNPAYVLAGKEVLIEQRVAFKLDLPDPKVISVKSKPKKQLHEVIRPILQKYNYSMDSVQVLIKDTQTKLDLQQPVTVVDGQRLQIVHAKPSSTHVGDYQNGCSGKYVKPSVPKSVSYPSALKQSNASAPTRNADVVSTQQSTLDEITNKVFNELMQGKVETHTGDKQTVRSNDLCSIKSDDCPSETSSIFDRIRRRDSSIPGFKLKTKKKSSSSQHSTEDTNGNNVLGVVAANQAGVGLSGDIKKPLIAKLKVGVKLQTTERVAENQDELLEGLKRAQLARLEDQRGTEINFELPEFLKNKDNLNTAASKLRKLRANLSPINKVGGTLLEEPTSPQNDRPQPAPRLSITNKNRNVSVLSPMKIDEEPKSTTPTDASPNLLTSTSSSSMEADFTAGCKGPPPLPPKPKVLPIKPSNWGVTSTMPTINNAKSPTTAAFASDVLPTLSPHSSKIPIDIARKAHMVTEQATRCAYLEEPSSSFV